VSDLKCDHTSVGIIARDEMRRILLVERANPPYGFAPPSGHCDDLPYAVAGIKEFEEETGLTAKRYVAPRSIVLHRPIKKFRCKRPKGDYHIWQIFELAWEGDISRSKQETRSIGWYLPEEIEKLMARTKEYLDALNLSCKAEEQSFRDAIKDSIEKKWQTNPGLELTWYEFFREVPELMAMLNVKKPKGLSEEDIKARKLLETLGFHTSSVIPAIPLGFYRKDSPVEWMQISNYQMTSDVLAQIERENKVPLDPFEFITEVSKLKELIPIRVCLFRHNDKPAALIAAEDVGQRSISSIFSGDGWAPVCQFAVKPESA